MAPGNRKNPRHAVTSDSEYMLVDFLADFPDDETCLNYLWRTRYSPDGTNALCERCECERVFRRYAATQQRQDWTCTACGLHVHPTAGTIFHKSSTGLHLWFYAMYLMTSTRCGISAKQLERELGVTYKTAHRMFKLIRSELMIQDDEEPLSGDVEMDETFVGGRPRLADKREFAKSPNTRSAAQKWADKKKVPVFGMIERGDQGRVRAYVVPSIQHDTLMGHVANSVKPATVVYTDDFTSYRSLPVHGFEHHAVNHSAQVYVSGNVHTQAIEGFWSQLKRGISGVHHSVSPKYLQSYVNEYVWRFNHRLDYTTGRGMFFTMIRKAAVTPKL
jgi:transposase-like protein